MHDKVAPFIALALVACSATARGPETYRHETQKALETRSAGVKSCYDKALETDPGINGLVAVRFIVERKTGIFTRVTIDPTKSTATETLVSCVLGAVNGLKLEPPDANEGQATFVYEFRKATPP